MKLSKIILAIAFVFFYTSIFSQSVGGVKFENYQAKISNRKKANLNLYSHKLGRKFRTAITEGYNNTNVDFGGHYIVVLWGCGTGCSNGVMVDINTGLIYSIPTEHSYRGVYYDNNDNIRYEKNSYLFYTYETLMNEKDEKKIDLHYYFYKFDEKTKKFNLFSRLNKTVESEDN